MSGPEPDHDSGDIGPARPNRRRRRYLPAVVALLFIGLGVEAGYAAFTSPRFDIARIDVRGNREVPTDEVLKQAGISRRTNIFGLQTEAAARRIGRLPKVRFAEVHRRLPDRALIWVEERRPVALLAAGERYYLVDETGVPYARLEKDGLRLPVLRLTSDPVFALGRPLKTAAFQAGMTALPVIRRFLSRNETLWVDPRLNLCLNRGDFSVRLGQPDGLAHKLKLLKALLDADPHLTEQALYLDLSAPDAPALMPREADAAPAERRSGDVRGAVALDDPTAGERRGPAAARRRDAGQPPVELFATPPTANRSAPSRSAPSRSAPSRSRVARLP